MNYVNYKDPATGQTMIIPEAELAPGCVAVVEKSDEGFSDLFYTPAVSLLPASKKRHRSLGAEAEKAVRAIWKIFHEFSHCETYNDWYEGFLFDQSPSSEIFIWLKSAYVFEDTAKGRPKEIARDIYRTLIAIQCAGTASVTSLCQPRMISKAFCRTLQKKYRQVSLEELEAHYGITADLVFLTDRISP
jgi:hypothetical protein